MDNFKYLKSTEDFVTYSKRRNQFRLTHFKKYNNTRYSKLKLGSLKNLIAYYKGQEELNSLLLDSLLMELEYRNILKQLNLSIKVN